MADLVALDGMRARDVDTKEIVGILEEWLDHARRGDFLCVGLVAVCRDHSILSRASAGDGLASLLGGLSILQYRMLENRPVGDPDKLP